MRPFLRSVRAQRSTKAMVLLRCSPGAIPLTCTHPLTGHPGSECRVTHNKQMTSSSSSRIATGSPTSRCARFGGKSPVALQCVPFSNPSPHPTPHPHPPNQTAAHLPQGSRSGVHGLGADAAARESGEEQRQRRGRGRERGRWGGRLAAAHQDRACDQGEGPGVVGWLAGWFVGWLVWGASFVHGACG